MSLTDGHPLLVGPSGFRVSATTCGLAHSAITCGIHLRQFKSADLQVIGVPSSRLGETADTENGRPFSRLAEVDPVLA